MLDFLKNILSSGSEITPPEKAAVAADAVQPQSGMDFQRMLQSLPSRNNADSKGWGDLSGSERLGRILDIASRVDPQGNSIVSGIAGATESYNKDRKENAEKSDNKKRQSILDMYEMYGKDRAYGLDQNKFGMEKDKFGFDKEKFGKEYGLKEKEMGIDSAYKQGMLSNAAANTEVSRAALDKSTLGNDINALIAQGMTKEQALDTYRKMHTTAGANSLDPRTKAILDADNAALTKQSPEAVRARVDALMGTGQQGSGVGNAMGAPAPQQMPAGAIQMLKKNPGLAQAFDQKYGAGASAQYIGK